MADSITGGQHGVENFAQNTRCAFFNQSQHGTWLGSGFLEKTVGLISACALFCSSQ